MKKTLLFLFISLLAFKSMAQITKEGYGNFLLGKTSLQSINQWYPDAKRQLLGLSDAAHVEIVMLKEEGVELFFGVNVDSNLDSVYLEQIDLTQPCYGKTEKNTGIGTGIKEVLQQYGNSHSLQPKEYKKSQLLHYGWITFYTHKGLVDRISINGDEENH